MTLNKTAGPVRSVRTTTVPPVLMLIILMLFGCSQRQDVSAEMDVYMDRAEKVLRFSGAVLVARGDSILFRHAYGWADIDRGRRATPEDKFLIGSITKSFTAVAVLQLLDRGKLRLTDTLAAYLPDYRRDVADRVTIHHLLSHQSGIPDLVKLPDFQQRAENPFSVEELITYFEDLPLEFSPGERYTYSSSNYVLLGKIIEIASGMPWENYVQEKICAPANMTNTGVFYDYGTRSDFAVGYNIGANHDTIKARIIHPSCGYAAGALASNVDDLYALHRELYGSRLLPDSLVEAMLMPRTPFYGYGWLIDELAGHRLTAHGGGTPGFTSMFQRWVDDSLCIVVLSNNASTPAHTIATGLAAIALGEFYELPTVRQPMAMDPDDLAQYEGLYQIDSGDYRIIELQSGRLMAQRKDNLPMFIQPESHDKFFFESDHMTTLEFVRDDSGTITAHVLKQAFDQDTARLVDSAQVEKLMYGGAVIEADEAILSKYVGRFRIEPAGFILTTTLTDGELFGQAFDSPPIRMLPVSDSSFAFEGLSARVVFVVNSNGAVDTLRFSQDNQTMIGIRIE